MCIFLYMYVYIYMCVCMCVYIFIQFIYSYKWSEVIHNTQSTEILQKEDGRNVYVQS